MGKRFHLRVYSFWTFKTRKFDMLIAHIFIQKLLTKLTSQSHQSRSLRFMCTFCHVALEPMTVSEKIGPCWALGFLLPLPLPCVLSELVIKQSYPHIVPKESWPPSWRSKLNPTPRFLSFPFYPGQGWGWKGDWCISVFYLYKFKNVYFISLCTPCP